MSKNLSLPKLPVKGDTSNITDINDLMDAVNTAFLNLEGPFDVNFITTYGSFLTFSSGPSRYVVPHGLGSKPTMAFLVLKCISGELGYSIGDEIVVSLAHHYGGAAMTIVVDVTNTDMRINTGSIQVVNKSTFAISSINHAKWDYNVVALVISNKSGATYYTDPTRLTGTPTSSQDDFNIPNDSIEAGFDAIEAAVDAGTFMSGQVTEVTETYISPLQVITAGSTLTLAHGLARTPYFISVILVCQTAELGYGVGDQVMISAQPGHNGEWLGAATTQGGFEIETGSTNIKVHIPSIGGETVGIVDWSSDIEDDSPPIYIDNTKWKVCIKAWA